MISVIERAIAADAKLVVADPRRTPLAKRAALHVALQPGTDLPVALALLRAMVRGPAPRPSLPIEALFVYNCNPVATALNQQVLIKQLSRDDLFAAVHEQVMTVTAMLADVVLPATVSVEHRELRRGYDTIRRLDARTMVAPPSQARSNNQLFGELRTRMGLTRPGDPTTDEELLAAIFAASPDGADLQRQLIENGVAGPLSGTRPTMFVDVFPSTPDQRVYLVPPALDQAATHGLYTYQVDPDSEVFSIALLSPALAAKISSTFGQLRNKPAQLELAHADALARNIVDGDACQIWNNYGEVRCAAVINHDLKPGVAVIAKGYWRKHTSNGFTANALITAASAGVGGQAAFNDARVQIEKR